MYVHIHQKVNYKEV